MKRCLGVMAALVAAGAAAETVQWTGASAVDQWADGGNWFLFAPPVDGDTVVFDANAAARLANDPGQGWRLAGLVVADVPGAVTLTNSVPAAVLTNGAGGLDLSAAAADLSLLVNLELAEPQTWNVAGGRTLNLHLLNSGRTLSGTGAVTLVGGGTVALKPGTVGSVGFNDAGSFNGFAGTWTIGTNVLVTNIRNGRTAFGTGSIRLEGGTLAQVDGNWTWTTPMEAVAGFVSTVGNRSTGAGRALKLQGVLSGAGALVFDDTVNTLGADTGIILTGTNSLSGLLQIGPNTEVRVGGVPGDDVSTAAGPAGTLGDAAVTNDGTLTFSRSDELVVSNAIAGLGAVRIGGGVAGVATQVVRLRGSNTYAGATTVSGGSTLEVDAIADGALSRIGEAGGSANGVLLNNGTLRYTAAAAATTTRDLSFTTGPATLDISDAAGLLDWSPAGGARTHQLTKSGPGTLRFGGDVTGTGRVVIAAGRLALPAAGGLASTPVITLAAGAVYEVSAVAGYALNAGQTLAGSGLVTGSVALAAGAMLSPGLGTGTLTVAGTLAGTAGVTNVFDLALPGVVGGGTNDLVSVAGDLDPAGMSLQLRFATAPASNGVYRLFEYTGALLSGFDTNVVVPVGYAAVLDTSVAQQVNVLVTAPTSAAALVKANNTVALNLTNSWVNLVVPGTGNVAVFDQTYDQAASVGVGGAALTWKGIRLEQPSSTVTIAGGSALNLNNSTNSSLDLGDGGRLVFQPVSAGNWYGRWTGGAASELTLGGSALHHLQFREFGLTGTLRLRGATVSNAFDYGVVNPTYMQLGSAALAPLIQTGAFALDLGTNTDERTILLDDSWNGATLHLRELRGDGGIRVDAGTLSGTRSISLNQTNDTLFTGSFLAHVSVGGVTRNLSLAKSGGGTLTCAGLVGRQTRSAHATLMPLVNITVQGGTLRIGDGVTEPQLNTIHATSVWTVEAGARLVMHHTAVVSLAHALAGAGQLVKRGAGDLRLSGANAFSGTLQVAEGVVALYTATAGRPAIELNGGRLALTEFFNAPSAPAVFAALSGTNAAAQLDPNYNHVYTAGVRRVVIQQDGHTTFAGQILAGTTDRDIQLIKAGTGTLALAGISTYGGGTQVSGGVLRVDGVIGTGAVEVAAGATLGGTGQVGGPVTSAGTVAPGDSTGALNLLDTYAQVAGGRLALEAAGAADHDVLRVTGAAQLDGELALTLLAYAPAAGSVHTVLVAAAVSGTFATTNLPALGGGLAWVVTYGAQEVTLAVMGGGAPAPYDLWAAAIPNAAQRGDQEDPDGDGYANLWEYSQGTDPTNSAAGLALTGFRTNGAMTVKFNRATGAVDLVYLVESAGVPTNGAGWTVVASNGLGAGWSGLVSETNSGPVVQAFATDPAPGSTNRALRLHIVRP